jgi:hypothetical protein
MTERYYSRYHKSSGISGISKRNLPSNGIKDFIQTLSEDLSEKNIFNLESYFTINRDEDPEFNLEYYLSCKKFINETFTLVGNELDNNEGNIISVYPYPNNTMEDTAQLEELKQVYKRLYLDNLSTSNHKLGYKLGYKLSHKLDNIYPNYFEDLLNQNKKTYEEVERELGIKNIIEQNDNEFLETMKLRIK